MKYKNLTYCEAKRLMKEGYAVKRPHWEGYWSLNEEGEIDYHIKGRVICAIEDSKQQQNDWKLATIDNCETINIELEIIKKQITVLNLETRNGDIDRVIFKLNNEEKTHSLLIEDFVEIIESATLAEGLLIQFIRNQNKKMIKNIEKRYNVKEFTVDTIDELFTECYDDMTKDAMSNNEDASNDKDDASIECDCIFCQSCK